MREKDETAPSFEEATPATPATTEGMTTETPEEREARVAREAREGVPAESGEQRGGKHSTGGYGDTSGR